jgi:hypothetical protein
MALHTGPWSKQCTRYTAITEVEVKQILKRTMNV